MGPRAKPTAHSNYQQKRQPGLFGYTKNVNNHNHDISVAEDSLEDYCLLEILGNEMDCGEREEHALNGGMFDDEDPLHSDSDDLLDPFEGIMSSLSRQFSNSSQNSLYPVFPGEFGEEHGLDGGTFDDDRLQCLVALDRQSSLIIASCTKNVNNHHYDMYVAEDSLEDYCLLEILGNEMECGEREEHGLDGCTSDDGPLQCLFALDRQSSLIIATGYCCDSPANDETKNASWLCHSTMHSKDASDVDKGINLTEGPDSPKNSLNRSIHFDPVFFLHQFNRLQL
jgi:hypothetical protein